jgi:hypothetical protein
MIPAPQAAVSASFGDEEWRCDESVEVSMDDIKSYPCIMHEKENLPRMGMDPVKSEKRGGSLFLFI